MSSSAECSQDKPPFSFVRGQDSAMWDIVWVSPQGHRSVSVSRHFLLQAPRSVPVPCENGSAETSRELTIGMPLQVQLCLLSFSSYLTFNNSWPWSLSYGVSQICSVNVWLGGGISIWAEYWLTLQRCSSQLLRHVTPVTCVPGRLFVWLVRLLVMSQGIARAWRADCCLV